jgi:hypothetical protein
MFEHMTEIRDNLFCEVYINSMRGIGNKARFVVLAAYMQELKTQAPKYRNTTP